MCLCKIENFTYGEIEEGFFRNPHPGRYWLTCHETITWFTRAVTCFFVDLNYCSPIYFNVATLTLGQSCLWFSPSGVVLSVKYKTVQYQTTTKRTDCTLLWIITNRRWICSAVVFHDPTTVCLFNISRPSNTYLRLRVNWATRFAGNDILPIGRLRKNIQWTWRSSRLGLHVSNPRKHEMWTYMYTVDRICLK